MRKLILILGLVLILANLAFAAEKEVFKSVDNKVVILSEGCTATLASSGDSETKNAQRQVEVKCLEPSRITVKKENIVIGQMTLTQSSFKVDTTGKNAGIVHFVNALGMKDDDKWSQEINGMNVETTNGIVLDFWNGKDTMDKKYDNKYFDNFLYKLLPVTAPEPVKDSEDNVVLDPNPTFSGKKVPKSVVTKFRNLEGESKLQTLKVCNQNFNFAWAEKVYGPSTSSLAANDPNSLTGRSIVSEEKTELFIEKEDKTPKDVPKNQNDGCMAKKYTLSMSGYKLGALSTSPVMNQNFCGVFFNGPNVKNMANVKCTQGFDANSDFKASLECDNKDCENAVISVTPKFNDMTNYLTKGIALYFGKDNPFYKMTTLYSEQDLKFEHDVELDVNDVENKAEPNGLIIYNKNYDAYVQNPTVIGVNKRVQLVSPSGYNWFSGSLVPKGTDAKAWQEPVSRHEKVAKIVPNGDYISVIVKGGNLVFNQNNQKVDFLLSNKYLQDSKNSFSGYEIKIKDDKVYEVAKVESLSKKTMTIQNIELRELKTNLEVPIFNGVQSVQSVDGKPIEGTPCTGLSNEGIFVNVKECGEFSGHCDAKAGLCVKISCLNNNDCAKGSTCQSNICTGGKMCSKHTDCDVGLECTNSNKCVAIRCSEDKGCDDGLQCNIMPGYKQGACVKTTSPGIRVGSSVGEPEQIEANKDINRQSVIILEPLAQGDKDMIVRAYFIYNTLPKEAVNDIVNKFGSCLEKNSNTADFVKDLKQLNPNLPEASNAPISEGSVAIKVPRLGYSYERDTNMVNINGCKWAAKKSIQSVVSARVPQAVKATAKEGEMASCRTDSECAQTERCNDGFCMQKVADGCYDSDAYLGDADRQKFRSSVVVVYKGQQKIIENADSCADNYRVNEAVCENGQPSIKVLGCENGCSNGKCNTDARTALPIGRNTNIPCQSSADCVYQNGVCENNVCINYGITVTRKGDMLCNAMNDCVPVCYDYDGGRQLAESGQHSIKSQAVIRDVGSDGKVAIRNVLYDRCVDGKVLEEATCEGANAKMVRANCQNGCVGSGRCNYLPGKASTSTASQPMAEKKPSGKCKYNEDCGIGQTCIKGECTGLGVVAERECRLEGDCPKGNYCANGECVPKVTV